MAEFMVTFAAGAAYGLSTVVVGQPLDTIKVRMQSLPAASQHNSAKVASDLFFRQGVRGLYRGGLPLFVGGSLMRSAQFGVSGRAKHWLEEKKLFNYKIAGLFDAQVIVAGIAGGLGRGIVEIPTDFFKTRRQVERGWSWKHVMDGTGVTLARNTVLYAAFMVYIDLSKEACRAGYVPAVLMTPDQANLTPFAKGAITANLAWLTIWPADVVKTQRQSGNYAQTNPLLLLKQNIQNGRMFRGVIPGLVRSTVANGIGMAVYEFVQTRLTKAFALQRKDMV